MDAVTGAVTAAAGETPNIRTTRESKVSCFSDLHTQAWYVVHTKPHQEFRALEHLKNQQFQCFLPTLQSEKLYLGKIKRQVEPLFSRYLFIRLDANHSGWHRIHSTRGVSRLVEFGGRPAVLSDAFVDALQSAPQQLNRYAFVPGEQVRITDGPLAGLQAIYQLPDGDERAVVLIELMCRQQRLKLPAELLRRA